jgi:hypothetical protein
MKTFTRGNTKITCHIRRVNYGYTGYIVAYEYGRRMWQESCEIVRVYKNDALDDAANHAVEIFELNEQYQNAIKATATPSS